MTMVQSIDAGASSIIAFGSLMDVARLQLGGASAETCDAFNTVNPLHAHLCKCCARKLPAFYACRRRGAGVILRRKPGAAMVGGWSAVSMMSLAITFGCGTGRGTGRGFCP